MEFEYLRRSIEEAAIAKGDIVGAWLGDESVRDRLKRNGINPTFFAVHFAGRVADYAFGVIAGQREIGNCPVIQVMLTLFKEKKIPLGDIFVICAWFKNAFLAELLKKGSLGEKSLKSAAYMLDMNFEGLIGEYMSMTANDKSIALVTQDHKETSGTDDKEVKRPCLSSFCGNTKTHMSAVEYIDEATIEPNDLDEMRELEDEALAAMSSDDLISEYGKDKFVRAVKKYAHILNSLLEFTSLGYALTMLTEVVSTCNVAFLPEQTKKRMPVFCMAMIEDLREWRCAVFERADAKDIHWMDEGFLSSASQLQIMLMPKVETDGDGEEELELF